MLYEAFLDSGFVFALLRHVSLKVGAEYIPLHIQTEDN